MKNFKKILAAVLSAAMVVTLAPAGVATHVQAATKATAGTSTLKVSATKATIKVGKTKTIKVTVNKAQSAALKVSLKSSKAAVAKVASKTTIKKGAKTATFKITAKKAGKANITVSYKTSANKTVKKTIKVTVNNSETNEDNVVVTDGKITIRDLSGFQSDNTALINDTLVVDIPADLGSMADIIWYRDGLALSTTNANQTMTDCPNTAVAGTYYATAITTKGTTYKSNTIKVVAEQARAVVESFAVEDVLDSEESTLASNISYNAIDANAIATVVLNKAYAGTVAVFRETDTKFATRIRAINTNDAVYTTVPLTNVQVMKNLKANARQVAAGVAGVTAINAYAYQDQTTGKTTYKFLAGNLTRGDKYVVAFDQNMITDDSFGRGKEIKNETSVEAPYLPAIEKVALSSISTGSKPEVALYGAEDAALTWIASANDANGAAGNFGLDAVTFYKNKVAKTTDGTKHDDALAGMMAANGVIKGGVSATSEAFWYVTVKTKKGIYGKDAKEITSEIKDVAQPTATELDLTQNSTTPSTLDVSFKDLRANGTLYIVKNNAAVFLAANVGSNVAADRKDHYVFDKNDPNSYEKSVTVEKGASSVSVTDIIKKPVRSSAEDTDWSYGYDYYQAIFIPDDGANYGEVRTSETAADYNTIAGLSKTDVKYNGLLISQGPAKLAFLSTVASKIISSTNVNGNENTVLIAQDAFGVNYTGSAAVFTGNYAVTRSSGKDVGAVVLNVTGNANGTVDLNLSAAPANLVVGEKITAKVGTQTVTFEVKKLDKAETNVADGKVAYDSDLDYSVGGSSIPAGSIVLELSIS